MKQTVKLKEMVFTGPGVLKYREADGITTHRIPIKADIEIVLQSGSYTWYEWVAVNKEMAYEER